MKIKASDLVTIGCYDESDEDKNLTVIETGILAKKGVILYPEANWKIITHRDNLFEEPDYLLVADNPLPFSPTLCLLDMKEYNSLLAAKLFGDYRKKSIHLRKTHSYNFHLLNFNGCQIMVFTKI